MQEGIANVDDYIWQLVASCIQIGSYNEVDIDGWLFISDVSYVASKIVACCDVQCSSSTAIDIMEGLLVRDFWTTLQEFGFILAPKSPILWLHDLQAHIDTLQEAHPLWPLLPTLEIEGGVIGVKIPQETRLPTDSSRVKAAICSNVEYLCDIGFLVKPEGEQLGKAKQKRTAGFTRSRRTDKWLKVGGST